MDASFWLAFANGCTESFLVYCCFKKLAASTCTLLLWPWEVPVNTHHPNIFFDKENGKKIWRQFEKWFYLKHKPYFFFVIFSRISSLGKIHRQVESFFNSLLRISVSIQYFISGLRFSFRELFIIIFLLQKLLFFLHPEQGIERALDLRMNFT